MPVCRVSGAQMLTRRGFPLDNVQLIGRWGSDASTHWHSICGWPYGLAAHRREYNEPAGPTCKRCFKLREAQEFSDNQPDDDDEL